MTPMIQVKPGVKLTRDTASAIVMQVVPTVFMRKGYDCWLTSNLRDGDGTSLLDSGLAWDFDSSTNIPLAVGEEIAFMVRQYLGMDFDVLWHGPRYHLHVEYDPK